MEKYKRLTPDKYLICNGNGKAIITMERKMTVDRLSEQEVKWDIPLYLYIIVIINSFHSF